ncbi:MATE family multidrug resistance protein [Peribacillus deserti]|uniref:Probable multidrug resistance protein NorM n=1 Tax=Peribacillus deserti TaxID=673318 RepID=A0ABS2QIF7_9BACI|nr:MATE family efflux transporter [Peribacillus deserti]MBM7692509.1 MATE family multidrug resistance protein [Peribacillus deserti]
MIQTFTRQEKIRQFINILLPILLTQLGLFSMTFFDTMMSGNASPSDLAGVAIGSSLWTPVFTGLSGILLAITPIVAQQVGAKKYKDVPYSVTQGIYLSFFMALFVILAGSLILNPVLNVMKLTNEVRTIAHDFLCALSYGIVPLFVYNALRAYMDALGQTKVSMFITMLSLPINVVLNYVLIFGNFGFPELGGVGSGYASAITYWIITIVAILVIYRNTPFTSYRVLKVFYPISIKEWLSILKIGVPIGFSIFFETSIFSAVTLLMSNYSTTIIASHQAALNFASFLYMIPLSISMSLTIVVGFEAGARRIKDAVQYAYIGIGTAVGLAFLCGIVLFALREQIASLYTNDPEVLRLTSHFLIFALFFQLSDALQAPIQGALRGYKDVNVTLFMSLISYWVIGLPTGYLFAVYTPFGAFGYWIGLITGLAAGATTLSFRLISVQRRKYSETEKVS